MNDWRTALLRNRHLLWLLVVLLLVAGATALRSMPREEDPRIATRHALVITLLPGASARRVEALVTEKIEEELREIPEIKHLESTSRAGVSSISIELLESVTQEKSEPIFSEVRDRLLDARAALPPGASAPIFDDQRGAVAFTLIAGLTWEGASEPLLGMQGRLAEDLADRLRNVPGTEIVRLYGAPEEEITVEVDPAELAALGMTASQVAARVAQGDPKVAAGVLRAPQRDLQLELAGELDSLEAVRAVPLRDDAEASLLRVGDVARVERGWRDPPREIALSEGRRSVLVAARVAPGRQVDAWIRDARGVVASFRAGVGRGVAVETVYDQSVYTIERLSSLATSLLLGAGVVMAVVVFTMGWRSALLVGCALPLVSAWTLFSLWVGGGALHQMSIFGMIIALGLLIDNAIVVVDETTRRMQRGMTGTEAVSASVRHLLGPLAASTLTTALAFAPIVLLPGDAGDFVGMVGGCVIVAIAGSFAISLTIIAALTGLYGDPRDPGPGFWRAGFHSERLALWAQRTLRRGLDVPAAAVGVAIALPLLGFALYPALGRSFFPPVERNMFDLQLWMPRQTSIAGTLEATRVVEEMLRADPEVTGVDWMVGGSFPSVYYNLVMFQDDAPYYAHAAVTSASEQATERLVPALQRELAERLPAVQVVVREFGQGPPVGADVEFRLYGPDVATLQDLGERVRLALQNHPDVQHTQVSMPRGEPRLYVNADADEALLGGFALRELAGQLEAELEGVTGGSILEELEELPVRVRLASAQRADTASLGSTNFVQTAAAGSAGDTGWVPLAALARLELRPELGGITRFDGVRCSIVKGYTRQGALPIDVAHAVHASLDAAGFAMPPGYRLELGGAVEADSEALGYLFAFVPVLAALMVATLVLTFRSVRLAVVLATVAGLSVGLAFLSTFVAGFSVSFNTILGTLGLIGVALNDSIVVLAAIRADPAARGGDRDAIVAAALDVARHVLSTTLTTIGGFLPLLVFIGGDFWPSLAVVLIGGVAGATLIALVFVPTAYAWLAGAPDTGPGAWKTPSLLGVPGRLGAG